MHTSTLWRANTFGYDIVFPEGQDEGGQAQAATGGAAAAVAAAVGRRLELMDGTFLATLDGYIQGASDKGAAEVAGG